VYGFLGDVNLFHGRAHQGELEFEGLHFASPEHAAAQNAKASAYVRPHDLEVKRYTPGEPAEGEARNPGLVVHLTRAIVVGPIARLELVPVEDKDGTSDNIIEAQIPADQYREMGLKEGETLVVTPKRARVFVESWE
jgi:sulfate transport system ATP-binding protein